MQGEAGKLRPTAFPLSDIARNGLSLVRIDKVDLLEFIAVADDIRRLGKADLVMAVAIWNTGVLRRLIDQDGARALCVFDDPVRGEPDVRDNEAHAIAVSPVEIDELDAKEIRDALLSLFASASSPTDAWNCRPPSDHLDKVIVSF